MPKINISASQTVYYEQTVTIPDELWEEYERRSEATFGPDDSQAHIENENWFQAFAETWLDITDVSDTDEFEVMEVTLAEGDDDSD